jgi:D-3-phosphoglycerate dehydrogenase
LKIVIADKMEEEVVKKIKELGEVVLTPSNLLAELADADVLIVRSATKVNDELLENAKNLKVVARAGVGLDNVDVEACKKRKIEVINTPSASSNAVAELTIGFLFAICRKIPYADSTMKAKKWAKKELLGFELEGKTLGIIGLGRIGSLVAKKARALGMNIIYFDKGKDDQIGKKVDLDELLKTSDFISLHLPLTNETRHIINANSFSKVKKTAAIINTGRGELIDEDALYNALKSGQIAFAALDVYSTEPYSGKLCELSNVILTPHIGGNTAEAQIRIGLELIEKLKFAIKK